MHDTVSGHELRILSCLRLQERRLKIRHMELQYELHARIPVFCYGCNGIEVLRQRCENPRLESEAASLEGFAAQMVAVVRLLARMRSCSSLVWLEHKALRA